MKMEPLRLHVGDCAPEMTIRLRVEGIPAFRFRLWLGGLLIRLGAGACGKWVHVEMEER